MIEKYKIYYLTDSTNQIRYIGLTCKKLSLRLSVHLNDYRHNAHKINWINKYRDSIKIVEIESDLSLDEAKKAEIQYIKIFKDLDIKLLNATEGGDCSPNKGRKASNKGVFKYDINLIKKIQLDYIPNVFGAGKLSKKYNIPSSTIERYVKISI